MANLGQIRERVLRNLKRLQVSGAQSDDVDTWINQIVREDLCADHLWPGMEQAYTINTTAGVELYGVPNPDHFRGVAWIELRAAAGENFRRLQPFDEDLLLRGFGSAVEGQPKGWAMSGEAIRIRPIADLSTYTLNVKVWEYPAELTSDSGSNWFTARYSKLIELGVTARACLQYGNTPEKWQIWNTLYREDLGKAISVDRRSRMGRDRTLVPSLSAGTPSPGLNGLDRLRTRQLYDGPIT